jgi:hypothetical protein
MYELLVLNKVNGVYKQVSCYLLDCESIAACKCTLNRLISKRILNKESLETKYIIRRVLQ